jgi:hypothetical protein
VCPDQETSGLGRSVYLQSSVKPCKPKYVYQREKREHDANGVTRFPKFLDLPDLNQATKGLISNHICQDVNGLNRCVAGRSKQESLAETSIIVIIAYRCCRERSG